LRVATPAISSTMAPTDKVSSGSATAKFKVEVTSFP
jgi:hypothetical protein